MPGLVPGIHVFVEAAKEDVDGRDKPGHDERWDTRHMTTTDDPLVSTEWLASHLGDPKTKIIDAQFKMPTK